MNNLYAMNTAVRFWKTQSSDALFGVYVPLPDPSEQA